MNITIIGDGGWGTALAIVLHNNGHTVKVWGPFPENIAAIQEQGINDTFLPGVQIPPQIAWTSNESQATQDAEMVVLAVPTQYFRAVTEKFVGFIPEGTIVVTLTKGLDRQTHQTMTQVAQDILGKVQMVALSGPSHAEEVALGIPTAVVVAAESQEVQKKVQEVCNGGTFRVYTSADVTGVQIGGALKNVIAIAVGISDGLGFGDNTRAALITRGLSEMMRLGTALHCDAATFAGLSGMGDLIVTCTSQHSRNRGVGERLGKGESLEQITSSMRQVAEGVWNCDNAIDLAQKHGIDLPITQMVYQILHGQCPPQEAVQTLMNRDAKPE